MIPKSTKMKSTKILEYLQWESIEGLENPPPERGYRGLQHKSEVDPSSWLPRK